MRDFNKNNSVKQNCDGLREKMKYGLSGLVCWCLAQSAWSQPLVLQVDNISTLKGHLMIALFNSEPAYSAGTQALVSQKIAVTAPAIEVNLGDLPAGYYAIKIFQDANNNGKLDVNMLGIPTEGYGFSNNGGAFGPSNFEDAKFQLPQNHTLTIHLR